MGKLDYFYLIFLCILIYYALYKYSSIQDYMPKISTIKIPEIPPSSPELLSKKELLLLVMKQAKQIELLISEVTELKRRVNMNSSNSSKPSSTDGYNKGNNKSEDKKKRSLREKSDKKR